MENKISLNKLLNKTDSICVIGLGYVGLPLAVVLAQKFKVYGFDTNATRTKELSSGYDRTSEITDIQLEQNPIKFSDAPSVISLARFIIVTVPTPIDAQRRPDLSHLKRASQLIGKYLVKGSIVVYESTVYPGCTEDECVPVIEKERCLVWGKDFFIGYSPERINPGDKNYTVDKIRKVVSGDSAETTKIISEVYGAIITAGVHIAPTIKTAEAAKVIENTQRDLNIALMNELALIFDLQKINTIDVLEAAGSKWNFLPFRPGLVGGHCIGVDPYYLTFKAESLGYHPEVILAGRRINDAMGKKIAEKTVKNLIADERPVKGSRVLILGWAFKENVSDIRNTRVKDIYQELVEFGVSVSVYDPHVDCADVKREYDIELINEIEDCMPYDAIILAVKHKNIQESITLAAIKKLGGSRAPIIIDVKAFFSVSDYNSAGLKFWQL